MIVVFCTASKHYYLVEWISFHIMEIILNVWAAVTVFFLQRCSRIAQFCGVLEYSLHLENDLCRLNCSIGNTLILHVLRTIKDCYFFFFKGKKKPCPDFKNALLFKICRFCPYSSPRKEKQDNFGLNAFLIRWHSYRSHCSTAPLWQTWYYHCVLKMLSCFF